MSGKNKKKNGLFNRAPTGEPSIPFVPTDENEKRIAELEHKVETLLAVVAGTLEPLQSWHPSDAIGELKKIVGAK